MVIFIPFSHQCYIFHFDLVFIVIYTLCYFEFALLSISAISTIFVAPPKYMVHPILSPHPSLSTKHVSISDSLSYYKYIYIHNIYVDHCFLINLSSNNTFKSYHSLRLLYKKLKKYSTISNRMNLDTNCTSLMFNNICWLNLSIPISNLCIIFSPSRINILKIIS